MWFHGHHRLEKNFWDLLRYLFWTLLHLLLHEQDWLLLFLAVDFISNYFIVTTMFLDTYYINLLTSFVVCNCLALFPEISESRADLTSFLTFWKWLNTYFLLTYNVMIIVLFTASNDQSKVFKIVLNDLRPIHIEISFTSFVCLHC